MKVLFKAAEGYRTPLCQIVEVSQEGMLCTSTETEYNKYTYVSPKSNSKYCIVSYNPEKYNEFIFAVKPLQSISEAVYILKDTLFLWFLCILIIALIVSIIFSKSVTKPIIKITEITKTPGISKLLFMIWRVFQALYIHLKLIISVFTRMI